MDLTFALQGFAILLTVVSIALLPSVMQREPLPTHSIALPHQQWPGLSLRAGLACLLLAFALLVSCCAFMLATA